MITTRHTSIEVPTVIPDTLYTLIVKETGEVAECRDMMPLLRMAARNLAKGHEIRIVREPLRTNPFMRENQ